MGRRRPDSGRRRQRVPGRNNSEGRLPEFIADVEAGKYPLGVVLLVEKLGHLSRQKAKTVFAWLLRITELGVAVCTVDGDRRYDAGNLDMAAIIEVVVKAQMSNEESTKKSERVGAAWAAKRSRLERGDRTVRTRRAPAWLAVEGVPAAFVVVEERAKVVRRIFEATASGLGKHMIARQLNREGVPKFGRAAGWHASYVQKVLASPAVLGEFQPGRKARGDVRTAAADPVPDYYPAIIDADLHVRAHAGMASRARARGSDGSWPAAGQRLRWEGQVRVRRPHHLQGKRGPRSVRTAIWYPFGQGIATGYVAEGRSSK